MKSIYRIISLFFISVLIFSCSPRIDLDEGQWGDQAFLTDVKLFIYSEEDHSLEEAENGGDNVTGIQRKFLSTTSVVDNDAAMVNITVPNGTDLTNVGIIFRHTAKIIEPLNGAPVAGYIDDFSNSPYSYRVISADGTERDWTIVIN
ncbi:MAG: DUF5018-related domain-containing protein [Draconibacterium sp.]